MGSPARLMCWASLTGAATAKAIEAENGGGSEELHGGGGCC